MSLSVIYLLNLLWDVTCDRLVMPAEAARGRSRPRCFILDEAAREEALCPSIFIDISPFSGMFWVFMLLNLRKCVIGRFLCIFWVCWLHF